MTKDQIKHMVDRFLGWRLPEHFRPDAGIIFNPEYNVEYNAARGNPPARHQPSGTNLFDATQAEAMVRYMLEELPDATYINGYQIKRLLDFVDNDDESEVSLAYVDHDRPDGNSNDGEMMPKGLYAWYTDYPDEGSMWLPETPAERDASVEPRSAPSGGAES